MATIRPAGRPAVTDCLGVSAACLVPT